MKKQGEDVLKTWKKRYFHISAPTIGEPNLLHYAKDEHDKEKGHIDMGMVLKVSVVDGRGGVE